MESVTLYSPDRLNGFVNMNHFQADFHNYLVFNYLLPILQECIFMYIEKRIEIFIFQYLNSKFKIYL